MDLKSQFEIGILNMKKSNTNCFGVKSFSVSRGDEYYSHDFVGDDEAINIRSISKLITTLCLGIEIIKNKTIDTNLLLKSLNIPIFNKFSNHKYFGMIKIEHLLNHSIGFEKGLLFEDEISEIENGSYLDYVFENEIKYEPGKVFCYTNVGFYILSIIFKEFLGSDLKEYATRNLFDRLDMGGIEWEKYGEYPIGASGILMNSTDIHKFGRLLLNRGEYNGKKVVPSEWIDYIFKLSIDTSKIFDQNRLLPKHGYGSGIWIAKENDVFFADGKDGQYLIISISKKICISITANQPDMKQIRESLKCMKECFT